MRHRRVAPRWSRCWRRSPTVPVVDLLPCSSVPNPSRSKRVYAPFDAVGCVTDFTITGSERRKTFTNALRPTYCLGPIPNHPQACLCAAPRASQSVNPCPARAQRWGTARMKPPPGVPWDAGGKAKAEQLIPSRTAFCAQTERVARSYGFTENCGTARPYLTVGGRSVAMKPRLCL